MHDRNGLLVEINDYVRVKTYNREHDVIGRIIRVTKGTEACNAVVAWPKPVEVKNAGDLVGNTDLVGLEVDYDYTQCNELEVVMRADGSPPK